ncbi:MAG: 5'-3' exonuclease [Opitutaceae bacterium]|jgi:DNA polymerase-1|nr:5'-3' exonuclease [Opitutaceae bacterium]
MGKHLLIDGHNLAYRCYYAIAALSRSDGFPTNALHGWAKSVRRLLEQERPVATRVFFDLGGSEERRALHADYKAQRKEMPEALARQIPFLKELSLALGCGVVEERGVESDDLLASAAVALAGEGDEVRIASSDKDFAQIVGGNIRILLPPPPGGAKAGWRVLDAAGVEEKFGVPPRQIADYLALVGDASDNIPGVPGVGPKTAARWLARFPDAAAVLAGAGELEPERLREVVRGSADLLERNLKLVRLNLTLGARGEAGTADAAALEAFLERFELRSALAEIRGRPAKPEVGPPAQGELF